MAELINKSKINIRIKVYVLIALVCALAVFWKQNVIKGRRNQQIVSMLQEWDKQGKPVQVSRITKRAVNEYTKVSIRLATPEIGNGFAVRDVRNKLAVGQEVYVETAKGKVSGIVNSIADNMDMNTGMFSLRITFNGIAGGSGQSLMAYVCTDTYNEAISVSNEIVDIAGNEFYVWKVKDGVALKTKISVKAKNGYGSIVGSGLEPGDMVIYRGQSLLKHGDRVRIIDGGDKS